MTIAYPELRTGAVGEVMTPGVLTCLPLTPLRDVARMMARHRVHAIVVFASDDRLHPWGVVSDLDLVAAISTDAGLPIGILSTLDVARAFAAEPGREEN
jgi:CBS domain-containing protein